MPGGIDPHTHLAMPFMGTVSADDFYRFAHSCTPLPPSPLLLSHHCLIILPTLEAIVSSRGNLMLTGMSPEAVVSMLLPLLLSLHKLRLSAHV
jgi:hypothetical protein